MRRVPKPLPTDEPAGLRRYREANQDATWKQFCEDDRNAKDALAKLLAKTQHGLCAYCEINIIDAAPFQVEHFLPKAGNRSRCLDFSNLMACCTGGVAKSHDRPKMGAYRWHYQPDAKSSASCGQAKEDLEPNTAGLIDPRTLPLTPRLVRIEDSTGTLVVDPEACTAAGISCDALTHTLEVLRLNCRRLCEARRVVLEELDREIMEDGNADLVPVEEKVLCSYLAPRDDGYLDAFWTVRRCFFDRRAETWITRNMQLLW